MTMRGASRVIAAAAGLLLVVLQVTPTGSGRPGEPPVPLAQLTASGPYSPRLDTMAQLQPGQEVLRGQECPGGSGSYCSDQYPVCCSTGGQFRCQASPADC